MKPISEMTAEQRLWASVLCRLLLDALDGPIPWQGEENDEYESRLIARDQVVYRDDMFVYSCDAVGVDPDALRERFMAGKINRGEVISLFSAIGR